MPRSEPGPITGLAEHQHLARRGGMLRRQAGDQPQDRALAAAAGAEHADELALVRQVFDEEIDVADAGEFVRLPEVVGLRDVPEFDHPRQGFSTAAGRADHDLRHADGPALARL